MRLSCHTLCELCLFDPGTRTVYAYVLVIHFNGTREFFRAPTTSAKDGVDGGSRSARVPSSTLRLGVGSAPAQRVQRTLSRRGPPERTVEAFSPAQRAAIIGLSRTVQRPPGHAARDDSSRKTADDASPPPTLDCGALAATLDVVRASRARLRGRLQRWPPRVRGSHAGRLPSRE
jgi:hypothetical protein